MYCECNVEIPNYSEYGVAKTLGIYPWISKNMEILNNICRLELIFG